jgi:Holliday junction resolvase RusA-like endonuclease
MSETMTIEQVIELTQRPKRGQKRAQRAADDRAASAALRASYRVGVEPVTFRLALPPPLNHYYRDCIIGSGRKAHCHKYISEEGKDYRLDVIDFWRREMRVTFEGRLAIKVVAVFRDHREPDLDALWKSLLDSLQHAGAYANDKQIKAAIIEQERIEAPGWIDCTLGPKRARQGTLFSTNW